MDSAGNPLPIEQVINPFGNGTAQSPAAVQDLVKPLLDIEGPADANWNYSRQDDLVLSLNGTVFSLPGGDVQLAIGAESRTEQLDYSDDQSRGAIITVPDPERDIISFFGELGVPLVGAANRMTGIDSLGLKMALRSDEYSFSGPFGGLGSPLSEKTFDSVSPKIELAWYPVSELKVGVTWGESFVPPTSNNLFRRENGPFGFIRVVDPENPDRGLQIPNTYFTGNPDLEPEISETLTVGFEWTPDGMLDGLSVKIAWFDTEFSDKFGSGTLLAFENPEQLFKIPGTVFRDAQGNIEHLNLFTVNLAERYSEYLDVSLRYQFDTA